MSEIVSHSEPVGKGLAAHRRPRLSPSLEG